MSMDSDDPRRIIEGIDSLDRNILKLKKDSAFDTHETGKDNLYGVKNLFRENKIGFLTRLYNLLSLSISYILAKIYDGIIFVIGKNNEQKMKYLSSKILNIYLHTVLRHVINLGLAIITFGTIIATASFPAALATLIAVQGAVLVWESVANYNKYRDINSLEKNAFYSKMYNDIAQNEKDFLTRNHEFKEVFGFQIRKNKDKKEIKYSENTALRTTKRFLAANIGKWAIKVVKGITILSFGSMLSAIFAILGLNQSANKGYDRTYLINKIRDLQAEVPKEYGHIKNYKLMANLSYKKIIDLEAMKICAEAYSKLPPEQKLSLDKEAFFEECKNQARMKFSKLPEFTTALKEKPKMVQFFKANNPTTELKSTKSIMQNLNSIMFVKTLNLRPNSRIILDPKKAKVKMASDVIPKRTVVKMDTDIIKTKKTKKKAVNLMRISSDSASRFQTTSGKKPSQIGKDKMHS